jgi:hypothetical protein
MYYQTRYLPTDVNVAYALSSGGEEIELPAAPPDLENEHPERKDCVRPYQKFKEIGLVAMKTDAPGNRSGGSEVIPIGGTDERIHLKGPTVALTGPPISAYDRRPYAPGVTQKSIYQPIGDNDRRPRSTTGAGTEVGQPVQVNGGLNSPNYDPYCCGGGPGEGTTNAGLGPIR